MTHFRHVCEVHGDTLAQCRCPDPGKAVTKVPCPGPPVCPQRGFTVTACELGDATALTAMHDAAAGLIRVALEARLSLLRLGFAADHSLCAQLDRTAAEYATVQGVLRRQQLAHTAPKGDPVLKWEEAGAGGQF